MDLNSFSLFQLSEEKEKKLFEDSLFFFDTSSLLSFYFFSENNRDDINNNVFKRLAGRLWITAQTEYEFLKDRETVLLKPKAEYESLLKKSSGANDGGHVDTIRNYIDEISDIIAKDIDGQLKTLQQKTEKKDKHPFLDQSLFEAVLAQKESLLSSVKSYRTLFDSFETNIKEAIDQAKNKIDQRLQKDVVVDLFEDVFNTTKPFTYHEVLELVSEGELRYSNSIPPGYEDEDKEGFQKYGDLIIWKQLIRQAKEKSSSVIYIINDKKRDIWQYRGKENLMEPRHELIKEFNDETGHLVWFYTIEDFLKKANKYLSTSVKSETIEDVKEYTKEFKEPKFKDIKASENIHLFHEFDEDVCDWIRMYIPDIKDVHKGAIGQREDYILRTRDNSRIYLYCKAINSKHYTRLMFPVREFFASQDYDINEREPAGRILLIEYFDKDAANAFHRHINKGEMNKLIKKSALTTRVIAILHEAEGIFVIFDSAADSDVETTAE